LYAILLLPSFKQGTALILEFLDFCHKLIDFNFQLRGKAVVAVKLRNLSAK